MKQQQSRPTPFGGAFDARKVLITGHTGFKGAWLSLWLSKLGARVVGFSLPPKNLHDLFVQANLDAIVESVIGDIRDINAVERIIKKTKPEIIFHLAAQPLVRESYRSPRDTFETNLMGTVNVLEASRREDSVRVCQVITSDKCYANDSAKPHPESDPMGGRDPYSASKGCAELVVASYRSSFSTDLSLSSVRAGNVIGGGDWAEDRIVPDCIRAFQNGQEVVLRNPQATRPWQHVLEPLSGYLLLASRQLLHPTDFATAFNFGPCGAPRTPVLTVVERLATAWGGGRWRVERNPVAPHEAPFLELDCSKAYRLLGWEPLMSLPETIDATAQWYRTAHQGKDFDAASFSLGQISEYEAKGAEAGTAWMPPMKTAA